MKAPRILDHLFPCSFRHPLFTFNGIIYFFAYLWGKCFPHFRQTRRRSFVARNGSFLRIFRDQGNFFHSSSIRMFPSCGYLHSGRANLLRLDVNFLNQNLRMSSWFGVFLFGTFLSVAFSESRWLFISGNSSSLFNSFFLWYLSIQDFSYVLSVLISNSKNVLLPLPPIVHLYSYFLHRFVCRIFFLYFGRSCFACISWFCPGIFWVPLHSWIFWGLFLSISLSFLSHFPSSFSIYVWVPLEDAKFVTD